MAPMGVPWPSRGVPWPLYEDHALEDPYYIYYYLSVTLHIVQRLYTISPCQHVSHLGSCLVCQIVGDKQ